MELDSLDVRLIALVHFVAGQVLMAGGVGLAFRRSLPAAGDAGKPLEDRLALLGRAFTL